jgi:hypothetical protein
MTEPDEAAIVAIIERYVQRQVEKHAPPAAVWAVLWLALLLGAQYVMAAYRVEMAAADGRFHLRCHCKDDVYDMALYAALVAGGAVNAATLLLYAVFRGVRWLCKRY